MDGFYCKSVSCVVYDVIYAVCSTYLLIVSSVVPEKWRCELCAPWSLQHGSAHGEYRSNTGSSKVILLHRGATNPTVKRTTAPSVGPDGTRCSTPTFAWSSVRFSFYWMSTGRMRRASTHKPWRARLLEHKGQEMLKKKKKKHITDWGVDIQDRERCIEDMCLRILLYEYFKTRSLG